MGRAVTDGQRSQSAYVYCGGGRGAVSGTGAAEGSGAAPRRWLPAGRARVPWRRRAGTLRREGRRRRSPGGLRPGRGVCAGGRRGPAGSSPSNLTGGAAGSGSRPHPSSRTAIYRRLGQHPAPKCRRRPCCRGLALPARASLPAGCRAGLPLPPSLPPGPSRTLPSLGGCRFAALLSGRARNSPRGPACSRGNASQMFSRSRLPSWNNCGGCFLHRKSYFSSYNLSTGRQSVRGVGKVTLLPARTHCLTSSIRSKPRQH